jgi:hypothetical protein
MVIFAPGSLSLRRGMGLAFGFALGVGTQAFAPTPT